MIAHNPNNQRDDDDDYVSYEYASRSFYEKLNHKHDHHHKSEERKLSNAYRYKQDSVSMRAMFMKYDLLKPENAYNTAQNLQQNNTIRIS